MEREGIRVNRRNGRSAESDMMTENTEEEVGKFLITINMTMEMVDNPEGLQLIEFCKWR